MRDGSAVARIQRVDHEVRDHAVALGREARTVQAERLARGVIGGQQDPVGDEAAAGERLDQRVQVDQGQAIAWL